MTTPADNKNRRHRLMMGTTTSFCLIMMVMILISSSNGFSLLSNPHLYQSRPMVSLSATAKKKKKGGTTSGGGFGAKPASSSQKKKPPSAKQLSKKLIQSYGGVTQEEIARGTQQRIDRVMQSLPPYMQMATQLYRQLQIWDAKLATMSVLDQTKLPPSDMDGARRAKEELEKICQEHDLTSQDLHNLFQQVTWDASADAKAVMSQTGKMPKEVKDRVNKACTIIAEAVGSDGTCLDAGCGYGVLHPSLQAAGLQSSQIYGVDLSPEMIRNAQEMYPDSSFEAADFFKYNPPEDVEGGLFEGIIFCASLHDMPDPEGALTKAASMLRSNGGTLVIVHPQGASHVKKQASANPVLVKRGLPTAGELTTLGADLGLKLVTEPVDANSREEAFQGYLAVLKKE